jgi:hypothetical protein
MPQALGRGLEKEARENLMHAISTAMSVASPLDTFFLSPRGKRTQKLGGYT